MDKREILAINIKYYRNLNKWSQEELAEYAYTKREYISELENAKRNTTLEMIERLARTFNVSVDDLMQYNENHIITKKRVDSKNES